MRLIAARLGGGGSSFVEHDIDSSGASLRSSTAASPLSASPPRERAGAGGRCPPRSLFALALDSMLLHWPPPLAESDTSVVDFVVADKTVKEATNPSREQASSAQRLPPSCPAPPCSACCLPVPACLALARALAHAAHNRLPPSPSPSPLPLNPNRWWRCSPPWASPPSCRPPPWAPSPAAGR